MTPPVDPELDPYLKAVSDKKVKNVRILDVREMTSIADYLIILSGHSHRQVTAVAEHIRARLKRRNVKPLNVEGLKEGHWVLMDYGDVIIHVFLAEIRTFYDLDGLWSDANQIDAGRMTAS